MFFKKPIEGSISPFWEELKHFLGERGFKLDDKAGKVILKFKNEEIMRWERKPSLEEILEVAEDAIRKRR